MVKFYTQNFDYSHPFPIVTLAYFLRYPNPLATHVITTDVISRAFDPHTQRLTTTRLHLKTSRVPSAILRLVPRSLLGSSSSGHTQSYILETSVVDVADGVMTTESRNLDFTNLLSVVERQEYRARGSGTPQQLPAVPAGEGKIPVEALAFGTDEATSVRTMVQLTSRIGARLRERRRAASEEREAGEEKVGFFARWSTSSLQRSIEAIGLSRTTKSQPNAKEGMKIVLERLREGGLVAVLDGMRRDREKALGMSASGN